MAQFKFTPQEFIQHTFSPMVAVISTPAAEQICQKNNLSFVELVQPFCKLNSEVHYREPSGNTITVKNLRIAIHDIDSKPPPPSLARKFLNESVSVFSSERNTSIQIGNSTVDIPASVPWFETWRETFLQVQFPSDHEFSKHYVACVLVGAAGEERPEEKLGALARRVPGHGGPALSSSSSSSSSSTSASSSASSSAASTSPEAQLPKWFPGSTPPLAAILLLDLHMQSAGEGAAALEAVRSALPAAAPCVLLPLNSRAVAEATPPLPPDATPAPDPWAQFLPRRLAQEAAAEADAALRSPADGPTPALAGLPSRLMAADDGGGGGTAEAASEAALEAEAALRLHPLSPVPGDVDAEQEYLVCGGGGGGGTVSGASGGVVASLRTPRGALLSPEDLERVRGAVAELAQSCLLPFVEKQLQTLADAVANKKGVSRSLLSATKRWFGSKPGAPGAALPVLAYAVEAPELQLRRLGDLSFMFGAYALAFSAFHSAKRDFAADGAWLHYAGALEMAALAAFLQGEPTTRKAQDYMEEAILTYLNTCKLSQWAVRATLLSAECLRARGAWGDAATQLIRMTSEDSDLRSALLLEQAAYCFLRAQRPPMGRKYAFHAVLAGHRFSKAGQRRHALRCYAQAHQVYEKKCWSLAEDHIHFTIGRQAANLRLMEEAVNAFAALLSPLSRQSAQQQAAFLREFICIQQQQQKQQQQQQEEEVEQQGSGILPEALQLPELPVPIIEEGSIKVLVGPLPRDSAHVSVPSASGQGDSSSVVPASGVTFEDDDPDIAKWARLEEALVTVAQKQAPMIFRPSLQMFSNRTDNSRCPIAVAGEAVSVQVWLVNPLQVTLPLQQLRLQWAMKPSGALSGDLPEGNRAAEAQMVDSLLLPADTSTPVVLSVVPRSAGVLHLQGLTFRLAVPALDGGTPAAAVGGCLPLKLSSHPPRPHKGRKEPSPDLRLQVRVEAAAPCLQVEFEGLSSVMLCGEVSRVGVTFRNVGSAPLTGLHVAASQPELFVFEGQVTGGVACVSLDAVAGAQLGVGQQITWAFWFQAPDTPCKNTLQMLVYYESVVANSHPLYRMVRHEWTLTTAPGLQVCANAVPSIRSCAPRSPDGVRVLNLPVQMQNLAQVSEGSEGVEVEVVQVALLSPQWRLCTEVVAPAELKLQPQEKLYFLLQVHRQTFAEPLVGVAVPEQSLSRLWLAKEKDEGQVSALREQLEDAPFLELLQRYINTSTADSGVEQKSAEADLCLVLQWQASLTDSGGVRRMALGQNGVRVRSGAPPASWPTPSALPLTAPLAPAASGELSLLQALQAQVTLSVEHSPRVTHDFSKSRLCVVPVHLLLQNCSSQELLVKVNTLGSHSGGGGLGAAQQQQQQRGQQQLYSPRASQAFRWVGVARAWLPLAPHARARLPLAAALPQPGTFDLGAHLEVWCCAPSAAPADAVAQRARVEAPIVVSS